MFVAKSTTYVCATADVSAVLAILLAIEPVESISEADSTQEDAKTETPETSAQMESTEDEKDSEKDKQKIS